jgi:hypothetical protein
MSINRVVSGHELHLLSSEQRRFTEQLQRIKPHYHKWYEGWGTLDYKLFYVMNSSR